MKCRLFVLLTLAAGMVGAEDSVALIETRKVWDQAPHNAFTGLTRFHDRWFCTFREGQGHNSPDGQLRVITSPDGRTWESAALITSEGFDLRDPKITVTPDGRLMLYGAEWLYGGLAQPAWTLCSSLAWFSHDGRTWSGRHEIGDPDFWLWHLTWHQGTAYGVGYGYGKEQGSLRLYSSKDGKNFETLLKPLLRSTYPNETSILFDGDTAYCLVREDPANGHFGSARPPYTIWNWSDVGTRIGGPSMVRLPDGRLVAAVRLHDGGARTSLAWMDPASGKLSEFLKLPSGGDTSYAGLVHHDNVLWVSYYSSHEGKTSIYLAKVRVD